MNTPIKGVMTVAAMTAAAGVGLWAGQIGLLKLPLFLPAAMTKPPHAATGAVIYYRDPDGRPFYSLTPKTADNGEAYIAVHASEDVSFEPELKVSDNEAADAASSGKTIKYYRNPMGLPDISPVPKKDSMGMDYIPVYEGEDNEDASIKIAPGKIQRTGVETVTVIKRSLVRTIRAPGVVQLDERRVAVVAPRFDGYVEQVGPVTTGTHVKKGDVLAKVFGQQVLNEAARLLVEQSSDSIRGEEASLSPNVKDARGVIGATRRLQNLGVPQEFMDQVKRERRVPDTFVYRSPIEGAIVERNWSDGQSFKAGDVGFRIADHTVVWMIANVAESDIDAVKAGQSVEVTTRARPGRTFSGKVTVVYPHLTTETRTIPVRIELPNPDLALLPDMYGEVEIATGNPPVLTVASSAVIDSGSRQVVLVDLGDGRYEPREVQLGQRGDGYVEVTNGVTEGDKVVSNGNFLIDAESNLQSALKAFETSSESEAHQ
jgi:Cu(I)/Ag(I) efflux system membrane fusion protein